MMDIKKFLGLLDRTECSHNILIIGQNANQSLKYLFEEYKKNVSINETVLLIDQIPKTSYEFWEILVNQSGLIRKNSQKDKWLYLEKEVLRQYFEENKGIYFDLFVQNLDKVFYELDKKQKETVNNSSLRKLVYSTEARFRVHGAALNCDSISYKETLGNSNFPFFAGNFLNFKSGVLGF